ncbi:hypothetical protein D0869_08070 [Hortaea werneckii]|uniref:Uncharacterized protein n=1 Tax=Hortaea werneckii TaxID=91943 RepID=A0A3M6YLG8_HORWE|nr:hypothetical protein D0869_08070 [Hortaea werneckii]RMY03769.1 hypothetical protein D0868_07301 [Hortaea werneckii]RMY37117.1 hypothetical protein D0866_03477 [Hortaea werneckii]
MLTQTLPTLGTSYPTEPPSSPLHHHSTTHDECLPGTTTTLHSSPNPSSPFSTSSTSPTGDVKIPHLPPELWLQIFPSVLFPSSYSSSTTPNPFPQALTNLHLVCRGFHSLLRQHEASLVRELMRTQSVRFPFLSGALEVRKADEEGKGVGEEGKEGEEQAMRGRRSLSLEEASSVVFPSSPLISSISSFRELWMLYRRLEAFSECEEVWRTCTSWGPEFAWGRERWERVHFLGLAGLVRAGDLGACSWIEGGGETGGESGTPDDGMDDDDDGDDKGISSQRPPPAFPLSSSGRTFGSASFSLTAGGGSNNRFLLASSSSSSFTSALEHHTNRLTHLLSLPPHSLALLLFKLHTALRILRVLGPSPLKTLPGSSQQPQTWDSTPPFPPHPHEEEDVWRDERGTGLRRCEVEVAVEECVLQYGPEVLVGLVEGGDRDGKGESGYQELRRRRVRRGRWARSLFETELRTLNTRQRPFPDGSPKPPTLIACLRRTFAEKTQVAFGEVEGKMWEVLCSDDGV